MRTSRIFIVAVLAFGLVACTSDTTYTDVGTLCVRGDPGAVHIVEVDFQACLSGTCDTVVESSCDVTQDGDNLTITATATVERKDNNACSEDCGQLTAECETDVLPAGSYNVTYGDIMGTLVVPPAVDEPTCFNGQ